MKIRLTILTLTLCLSKIAFADDVSQDDATALVARAGAVRQAMDRGDAEAIISLTHPSIYRVTNGKEGFEKLTRQSCAQITATGMKILESTLGTLTSTYQAGDYIVCFVPRTTIAGIQGKKVRSIGFLIAIRGGANSEWLFLDGAGLRQNPGALKILLPGLPESLALPENRKELIE